MQDSFLAKSVFYAIPAEAIRIVGLNSKTDDGSRLYVFLVGPSFLLILAGALILINALLGSLSPALQNDPSKNGLIFEPATDCGIQEDWLRFPFTNQQSGPEG